MTIYNIFDYSEKSSSKLNSKEARKTMEKIEIAEAKVGFQEEKASAKDRFFSSLAARFFFLLLLVADALWGIYVTGTLILVSLFHFASLRKFAFSQKLLNKFFLSFKRFLVCGLSLFVALFTPALGIMFACTYFLMYDKEGIDEVVPSSLQGQFKEFFSA